MSVDAGRALRIRLIASLTLAPMVPVLAGLSVTAADSTGLLSTLPGFDDIRWFNLALAVLTTLSAWFLWHRFICWTLDRAIVSAAVGFIPFVQVIVAVPLWRGSGCFNVTDTILQISQEQAAVAFFAWTSTWVWWGSARFGPAHPPQTRWRMTTSALRILRSLAVFPLTFAAFCISIEFADSFTSLSGSQTYAFAYAAAAAVAILCWILIWRKAVAWTNEVLRLTILSGFLLIVVAISASLLADQTDVAILGTLLFFAPIIAWGVWMIFLVRLWPLRSERAEGAARAEGPACPGCGYSLSGLSHTRCPECGLEPTLDELWRMHPESGEP